MATAITTRKAKLTNQRILLVTAVICLACFLNIAFSRGYFDGLNAAANQWAASIQTVWITQVAEVANFFNTTFLLVVALAIAGLLAYKHHVKDGLLLAGAMALDAVLLQGLKTLIISPRPVNALIVETDYSFPSGHVTTAIVFLGILTYLAWQNRSIVLSTLFGTLTLTAGILMGFDRIYLNVHWLSDVLAAPFLSVFVIVFSLLTLQLLISWYDNGRLKGFRRPQHSSKP